MRNICYLLYLFIPAMFTACQPAASDEPTPPNVILVMTDDQGYGDLACHGNPWIQTPVLDQLYASSIRLTNYHSGTTCSPTRAGLMTGRNCNRTGVWHTVSGRSLLRKNEVTMADIFAQNGYRTGMFGKWHLGDNYPFRPQDRGFQEVLWHRGGGVGNTADYFGNTYFNDTYYRNGKAEKKTGYCTDVWFEEALSFIERNKDQPFFCYLSTNAPHGPFVVDSSYIRPYLGKERIPNPNFYGMITNIDENMGILLQKLDEWGLAENTLLIFTTDNGTAAGIRLDEQGFPTDVGFNAGMRGLKGSQWEGGHRVPCFLRWPAGQLGGGQDIDRLCAHTDLLPTLISLCGLDYTPVHAFDGTDLSPLLRGKAQNWPDRVIITDTQRKDVPVKWRQCAIMTQQWRLINGEQLYDIQADPGQREDVAAQHPEVVQQLRQAYEDWWNDLSPSFEDECRSIIGHQAQNPLMLTSHDWHAAENAQGEPYLNRGGEETPPWNQIQVRLGQLINGYWSIEVAEAGEYEFRLRRWPEETGQPIRAGIAGMPAVPGGRPFPEGKALNITQAAIQVGNETQQIAVSDDMQAATFRLQLPAGPAQLKTWFTGPEGLSLGAYYVYAEKL